MGANGSEMSQKRMLLSFKLRLFNHINSRAHALQSIVLTAKVSINRISLTTKTTVRSSMTQLLILVTALTNQIRWSSGVDWVRSFDLWALCNLCSHLGHNWHARAGCIFSGSSWILRPVRLQSIRLGITSMLPGPDRNLAVKDLFASSLFRLFLFYAKNTASFWKLHHNHNHLNNVFVIYMIGNEESVG